MTSHRSTLYRSLFIALLLCSQWLYAHHESSLSGLEHHHSAECIVCFSHANTGAVFTSMGFLPSFSCIALLGDVEPYHTVLAYHYGFAIRAPPLVS